MLAVYHGRIGEYGYAEKPWFLPNRRLEVFLDALRGAGLHDQLTMIESPAAADEDILAFHTRAHLDDVRARCAANEGALDHGATPARQSVETAATHVVGAVADAARRILAGERSRAFVPIAGFHHAHRDQARSYCLYNDAAIAISILLERGIERVAYVDIDVHQGDGVYQGFADETRVLIVDVHEDWSTLWPHSPEEPGTGHFDGRRDDRGALDTKLNIPLAPGAGDAELTAALDEGEQFLGAHAPGFFIFEAGVDGMAGDPMAHLRFTDHGLTAATRRMRALADRFAEGRLLVLGGGGYDEANVAAGWTAVVRALV